MVEAVIYFKEEPKKALPCRSFVVEIILVLRSMAMLEYGLYRLHPRLCICLYEEPR